MPPGIQFHSNRVDSGNERGAGVEDTLATQLRTKCLSSERLVPSLEGIRFVNEHSRRLEAQKFC